MNHRSLRRRAAAIAAGTVGLIAIGAGPAIHADTVAHADSDRPELAFTPITTDALSCAQSGAPRWANDLDGNQIVAMPLMQRGDAATPLNAPATSTAVGSENDMIAISPDGRYLFSVSEASPSDGVTRLALKGRDKGDKVLLASDPSWKSVDGAKWYPYGGPRRGVLLIGEEFATGGVWQVNPDDGQYARLSWLGDMAHEGIGLDRAGNLYFGDENRAGGFFKAVPTDRRDLTKGGTLYYLVPTSVRASGWKQITDAVNATAEAQVDGVLFDRPEDVDQANDRIYFTVTEPKADADARTKNGNKVNRGGIYSFTTTGVPELSKSLSFDANGYLTPMIEVQDPKYVDAADAADQQGLQFPDNIAFDGHGNLWVHEDIPDGTTFPASGVDVSKQVRDQQDELYVFALNTRGTAVLANPDTTGPGISGGYKAADMRSSDATKPCANEFTGGIFRNDVLFINQQHNQNVTFAVEFED